MEGIGLAEVESSHTSQHMGIQLAVVETTLDSVASGMGLETVHSWDAPEGTPRKTWVETAVRHVQKAILWSDRNSETMAMSRQV